MSRFPGWAPVLAVLTLQAACATTSHEREPLPERQGNPDRYAQTLDSATSACLRNPACYTQRGSEAVVPWASRSAQAASVTVGALRLLEAAEVRRIEQLLVQCAREADFEVNEREYGRDGRPDDAECERVVGYTNNEPVRRRMELGTMKHDAAFACVRREIVKLFPDNVSIEPRYGLDPQARRYVLTTQWRGSLKPDFVLHAAGSPDRVQCVYDFKFPCSAEHKSNPFKVADVSAQLRRYEKLGGHCPPAIVTPQLGINRN